MKLEVVGHYLRENIILGKFSYSLRRVAGQRPCTVCCNIGAALFKANG